MKLSLLLLALFLGQINTLQTREVHLAPGSYSKVVTVPWYTTSSIGYPYSW